MNLHKLADWYSKIGESDLCLHQYSDGLILYVQRSEETTQKIRDDFSKMLRDEGRSTDGLTSVFIIDPPLLRSLGPIERLNDQFGPLGFSDHTDEIGTNTIQRFAAFIETVDLDQAQPIRMSGEFRAAIDKALADMERERKEELEDAP